MLAALRQVQRPQDGPSTGSGAAATADSDRRWTRLGAVVELVEMPAHAVFSAKPRTFVDKKNFSHPATANPDRDGISLKLPYLAAGSGEISSGLPAGCGGAGEV